MTRQKKQTVEFIHAAVMLNGSLDLWFIISSFLRFTRLGSL